MSFTARISEWDQSIDIHRFSQHDLILRYSHLRFSCGCRMGEFNMSGESCAGGVIRNSGWRAEACGIYSSGRYSAKSRSPHLLARWLLGSDLLWIKYAELCEGGSMQKIRRETCATFLIRCRAIAVSDRSVWQLRLGRNLMNWLISQPILGWAGPLEYYRWAIEYSKSGSIMTM